MDQHRIRAAGFVSVDRPTSTAGLLAKADVVAGRKRLFVLALQNFSLDLRIFSVTFYFSSYNAKCRSFSPVPFTQVMSILAKDDLGSFVLWI
jgi:hypothetical protein